MALTVVAAMVLRVFRLGAAARCRIGGFTLTLAVGLVGWNCLNLPASLQGVTLQLDSRWYVAMVCGWGTIAGTLLLGLLRGYGAMRWLLRSASPAEDGFPYLPKSL